MLLRLNTALLEGGLTPEFAYLAHIKKEDEQKTLSAADALLWEEVESSVRGLIIQHMTQMFDSPIGDGNFPSMYTGELLSAGKVAGEEWDETRNMPTVEALEQIRDMSAFNPDVLVNLGNVLAYKIMSAGAIRNHLLAVVRFSARLALGEPETVFVFATLFDMDDREESLLDQRKGRLVKWKLYNVLKRSGVSRAVLFPCLDDDGKEMGDLLVYARSGSAAWFKALEVDRRLNPKREGTALVKMMAEQTVGGAVPPDVLQRMGEDLEELADEGVTVEAFADSMEKAVGHGIDRLGLEAQWENTFGDLSYRANYNALFGGVPVDQMPQLKMQAGVIKITLPPTELEHFRQISVGDRTFIIFEVPEDAKVVLGKDLDLRIKKVRDTADLVDWMTTE